MVVVVAHPHILSIHPRSGTSWGCLATAGSTLLIQILGWKIRPLGTAMRNLTVLIATYIIMMERRA
jgi:hypothetical protein